MPVRNASSRLVTADTRSMLHAGCTALCWPTMQPREPRRDTTFTAPVGSVNLAAFDDDGEPYEIHACDHCLPWHAEVHLDDDGAIFVREWHAVECQNSKN